MRMSAASESSKPPANAQPLTAAMTGLEKRWRSRVSPPRPSLAQSASICGVAPMCSGTYCLRIHAAAEERIASASDDDDIDAGGRTSRSSQAAHSAPCKP